MVSSSGGWFLENSNISEFSHNEGRGSKRNAKADRSKHFMDSIGNDEGAGSLGDFTLKNTFIKSYLLQEKPDVQATENYKK
jgi:hypothetical protein